MDTWLSIVLSSFHSLHGSSNDQLMLLVNSYRDPVRVRDDGDRWIKLKGLSIPLQGQKRSSRRPNFVQSTESPKAKAEKRMTGARIEFTTQVEKRRFLETFNEVQGTFFADKRTK